jgi:hypothetical protein
MKRAIIILYLLGAYQAFGQVKFRTVVPKQYVVVGESFQVQYIIENGEAVTSFVEPAFRGFRRVAGPYVYSSIKSFGGNGKIRNTVYTLTALSAGTFVIRGAVAVINGQNFASNDVILKVISRDEASQWARPDAGNSGYLLRPGEDPYEKIKNNLFVKVQVNKRICFVGEPVVATFKLYSRLESRSDIIKNPGFYGFTVYDMVSLTDRNSSTELVNGKLFDVHTIRQVQLFPLQDGRFIIDGMEIKNTIEFSRSQVNKKTEQEIVEGVLQEENTNFSAGEGTETYETRSETDEIVITVKPFPARKPSSFSGASGQFSLSSFVHRDSLTKNEQGVLEICIRGSGNFTQINPPRVSWPAGVEGFDPVISDSLDKTKVPLTGARTFRYSFISIDPGIHVIPGIVFSYFDPLKNRFDSIGSAPIEIRTSDEKAGTIISKEETKGPANKRAGKSLYWIAGFIAALAVFLYIKTKKNNVKQVQVLPEPERTVLAVHELLVKPELLAHADDREFYTALREAIWTFFSQHLEVSGSELNKHVLKAKLQQYKVDPLLIDRIRMIIEQCEAGIYTQANFQENKLELLQRAKETVSEIRSNLL